jgi:hypothetical protein
MKTLTGTLNDHKSKSLRLTPMSPQIFKMVAELTSP